MRLKQLYLRNFRNYKEAAICFSEGVNCIYGNNAQGKTNLLEAVHLLMTGRSFRTRHLSELIYFGADSFYLEVHFEKNGVDQCLKISCRPEGKKIILNATAIPTLSSLFGILHGVILSPEDHEIIQGAPARRRQFLDLQIAQTQPYYLHHLSRYFRAMKQRNTLLRQRKLKTIEIFEQQMAESAAYLTDERKKATKEINELIESDVDRIQLNYISSAESIEAFLRLFSKQRSRECELGTTLSGPHKDNLEILINGNQARLFGSEGQKRSCIAALRLAEWKRLKSITDQIPLICIDDVGISLDRHREENFLRKMDSLGQVFLTAPKLEHAHSSHHLIHISNGSCIV